MFRNSQCNVPYSHLIVLGGNRPACGTGTGQDRYELQASKCHFDHELVKLSAPRTSSGEWHQIESKRNLVGVLMIISVAMMNPFLKAFPRPVFKDQEKNRLASACSDINALSISLLFLYSMQNHFWTKGSSHFANVYIFLVVVCLFIERWVIFKGWLRASVLSYVASIGVFWLALTYLGSTIRHTQTMVLCFGLAYITISSGARYGFATLLAYVGLLAWGTSVAQESGLPHNTYAQTMKHFYVATCILIMQFGACTILRQNLITKIEIALKERDKARKVLEATNQKLLELLDEKSSQLNLTVAETNRIFIRRDQFENLGMMVSGLSHELGTPIGNAVLTASNLVVWSEQLQSISGQDELGARRLIQHMLDGARIIRRNLERINNLVTNFKGISLDQVSGEIRMLDLSACIKQCIFALSPTIEKHGAQVRFKMDEAISMRTYPFAVEQIVTNLVTNSIHHGLDNKPDGVVTIATWITSGGSEVCIEVSDNGWGIHQNVVNRIFEPFFTTKRGSGGTGMGLSIVHHLATEILAGSIEVKTGTGGSIFTVTCPLTSPKFEQVDSGPATTPGFLQ